MRLWMSSPISNILGFFSCKPIKSSISSNGLQLLSSCFLRPDSSPDSGSSFSSITWVKSRSLAEMILSPANDVVTVFCLSMPCFSRVWYVCFRLFYFDMDDKLFLMSSIWFFCCYSNFSSRSCIIFLDILECSNLPSFSLGIIFLLFYTVVFYYSLLTGVNCWVSALSCVYVSFIVLAYA